MWMMADLVMGNRFMAASKVLGEETIAGSAAAAASGGNGQQQQLQRGSGESDT